MSIISPSLSVPAAMPLLPDGNPSGMAEQLMAGAHASGAGHDISASNAAGSRQGGARPAPAAVGKAFEELFASILIKQMRHSLGSEMFGHDPGDVCGGLFDHFMSHHIAQRGGLGIGKMIEKHLQHRSQQHE